MNTHRHYQVAIILALEALETIESCDEPYAQQFFDDLEQLVSRAHPATFPQQLRTKIKIAIHQATATHLTPDTK